MINIGEYLSQAVNPTPAIKKKAVEIGTDPKTPQRLDEFLGNMTVGIPITKAVKNTKNLIINPKAEIQRRSDEYTALTAEQKQQEAMNMAIGATFGGPKAKGFAKAQSEGKTFGNIIDKFERIEINDNLAKLKDLPSTPKGYALKDVIKHKELFKQYPMLKDMTVVLDQQGKNYYNPQENSIHLASEYFDKSFEFNPNISNPKEIIQERLQKGKESLLHEIQHAIQEKEGFVRGGSMDKPTPDIKKKAEKLKEEYSAGLITNKEYEYQKNKLYDTAFKEYLKLAGEIESRDVSARMNLTPEQRANTSPYSSENIPVNEWIVNKQSGPSASMTPEFAKRIAPKTPAQEAAKKLIEENGGIWKGVYDYGEPGIEPLISFNDANSTHGGTMHLNLSELTPENIKNKIIAKAKEFGVKEHPFYEQPKGQRLDDFLKDEE